MHVSLISLWYFWGLCDGGALIPATGIGYLGFLRRESVTWDSCDGNRILELLRREMVTLDSCDGNRSLGTPVTGVVIKEKFCLQNIFLGKRVARLVLIKFDQLKMLICYSLTFLVALHYFTPLAEYQP